MATTMGVDPIHSYHFSLGDSADGPVGACARVLASSEEAAVRQLRALLESKARELVMTHLSHSIESLTVYFNPSAISANAIDEVDDLDEEV